ncbi:MAG TPA: hypoxanthine phosphoribosyltransferase [Anaerolineae bacterium]|nr:hypoxanthine phosphoribosyltransferase [Anaerolineae bacterium]HMR66268.1 hypoxanthine phosphoribosyltransferase [Anaerolineae bacterium]
MAKPWQEILLEVLIDEERLQAKVKELGALISEDYRGKDLLLLCILKGGIVFLTDLMRQISIPLEIDFLAVSSYGRGARQSSGVVRIIKDLEHPVAGKHILIVEDIIDSGHTLNYISRNLATRNPASLKICTLLDKAERREVDIPVDYVGFVIPDRFVFGYGLDIDEKYRELPFVGVVKPNMVLE